MLFYILNIDNCICVPNNHGYTPFVVITMWHFLTRELSQGCNKSNTTDATAGTGTAYPSGSSELTQVLSEVPIARSLDVCVIFGRSLFVLPLFLTFGHCIVCPSTIYGLQEVTSALYSVLGLYHRKQL